MSHSYFLTGISQPVKKLSKQNTPEIRKCRLPMRRISLCETIFVSPAFCYTRQFFSLQLATQRQLRGHCETSCSGLSDARNTFRNESDSASFNVVPIIAGARERNCKMRKDKLGEIVVCEKEGIRTLF